MREQIDAGAVFLSEFKKTIPVLTAFWLKAGEDALWYLYVVSDRIDSATIKEGYGEVLRIAGEMRNPNFKPFRVKLIEPNDVLARAALEVHTRHPVAFPTHFFGCTFGGMGVEEVYIYP